MRPGSSSFHSWAINYVKKNSLNTIYWVLSIVGQSWEGALEGPWSRILVLHGHLHWCTRTTAWANACFVFLIISWLVRKSWIQVLCFYLTKLITWAYYLTSLRLSLLNCGVQTCLSPRVSEKDYISTYKWSLLINLFFIFCFKWCWYSIEWGSVLLSFGFKFLYMRDVRKKINP